MNIKKFSLIKCLGGLLLASVSLLSQANINSILVYNGNKVSNQDYQANYPFVVAVYNNALDDPSESACTGSIIANQWVLTASHCVIDGSGSLAPANKLFIMRGYDAGNLPTASGNTKLLVAKDIIYDNKTKMDLDHDVALLKLVKPITDVTPIKLPTQDLINTLKGKQQGTVLGFGFTAIKSWKPICKTQPYSDQCTFEENRDGTLHSGHQSIQTDNSTIELLKKYTPKGQHVPVPYDSQTMFGGLGDQDRTHVSNGDSGGPFLVTYKGIKYQIGVNSWGIPISYSSDTDHSYYKEPNIFVNLSNADILKFIHTTISDN